jgi:hypothetical protein
MHPKTWKGEAWRTVPELASQSAAVRGIANSNHEDRILESMTWEGGVDRLPVEPAHGSYACTGTEILCEVELITSHVSTFGVPSITFAKVFNTSE